MLNYKKKAIVIGIAAALSVLGSACDDLNTGLVKRGYNYLINYPFKWTHPANLETDNINFLTPDLSDATEPRVSMDRQGNTIIVWRQKPTGGMYNIYKSEYRNGVWSHPADKDDHVNTITSYDVLGHSVAMGGDGTAIIAWLHHYGGGMFDANVKMYRNGLWETSDQITSSGSECVAVAINDFGNGYVVVNDAGIINRAEINNGNIVYPPEYVPMSPNTTKLQVAVNNRSSAIIVWEQLDGGFKRIYMNHKIGSVWSGGATGTRISPDGIGFDDNAMNPQVALSDNGTAVIVWTQEFNAPVSPTHVYRSYYNGTSWNHPTVLTDCIDPVDPGDPHLYRANFPDVAIDSSGNAVMVWRKYLDAEVHLQMSQCLNGIWTVTPYSQATSHFDPDGGSANIPDVAMDNSGNAVIVWDQFDGVYNHIYKSEFRNGRWSHPAGPGDSIDAKYPDVKSGINPNVVMNGTGSVVIAWEQLNFAVPVYKHIYKSEYRPYEVVVPFK